MTTSASARTPHSRYPHLAEGYAPIADLSKDERIAFIWRDRFIEFDQTTSLLKAMERLYQSEDAIRPRGMLLVGESLMGKSFVVDRFLKLHPAQDNVDEDAASVPIVHVQIPERARNDLYREILLALKAKIAATAKPDAVRTACIELLKSVGMRILIIEEVQHLTIGTAIEQEASLNKLKYIMSVTKRPIVVTGVESACQAISSDTQIRSRFRERRLYTPAADADEYADALILWEQVLPLRFASNLHSPTLAQAIYNKTRGVTGHIAQLLQHSAELAIESGDECITVNTLDLAEQEMGELVGAGRVSAEPQPEAEAATA